MGASNQLLRLTSVSYGDGLSSLKTGADPVEAARIIFDQDGDMPNQDGLADLFVSWGQFIDHDLSLTPDASGEHVFVPGLVAPLERSVFDDTTGVTTPREQINVVEQSMNGSMVYGSDAAVEALLRTHEGGQLKMGDDGLLILTDSGMAGASAEKNLFLAGDVRANENTGLTTLHNLFSMEHNHWAKKIADLHPDWTDEQIFQAARSIVEYEIQKITYDDWLPLLVGDAVGSYQGYDASVDGRIATEFSTAAFRFGHTMVSPTIKQVEEDGTSSAQGDIRVQDAFFNISQLQAHGIEDVLRGMTEGRAQMSDAVLIDDLNFFLESPGGVTGFSLASLNILRGRDHGLGSYVDVRAELLGDVDPATIDLNDFSIITADVATQAKLAQVYGTVDKVDLWVGGLAEDDIGGTQLGPLFTHIVADQFARTRAADDSFSVLDPNLDASILVELSQTTLGDIVTRNTDVSYTQENVFLAADRIGGGEGRDRLVGNLEDNLIIGFGGNDRMFGRGGDDALYGGDGNDVLSGHRGDDALYGGDGFDRLFGHRGDDALYGGDGHDRLMGHQGDDTLNGGAGRDRLIGDSGDDRLDGGADRDDMRGGRGDDTFVFSQGSGRDIIRDFGRGNDVIELSGFGLSGFDDVMSVASQRWSDVQLRLGDDLLVVKNTHLSSLDAEDFILI